MNIEDFREYCLSKPAVTEAFPFDENVLVFKVGGKIFSLCDINSFASINLKCDPEYAIELREQYNGVTPGFHMNKKHWNTVLLNRDVDAKLLKHLIDHSYTQVFKSLTKKLQAEIGD